MKGEKVMYFTDTPELRKFEKEMRQKPNFDRCSDDYFDSKVSNHTKNKNENLITKNNDGG